MNINPTETCNKWDRKANWVGNIHRKPMILKKCGDYLLLKVDKILRKIWWFMEQDPRIKSCTGTGLGFHLAPPSSVTPKPKGHCKVRPCLTQPLASTA